MNRMKLTMWTAVMGVSVIGCAQDRPADYGRARPPIDSIDPKARGLQGADVEIVADQMARDLLSLPEINFRARCSSAWTRWKIRLTADTT